MRFLFWLTLICIVLPLVELALLLKLGQCTSWKVPFLLVIFTAVGGVMLAKSQGIAILRRLQTDLQERRAPAGTLVDGVLILVAGFLLLAPGLLTDLVAITLLIPPSRYVVKLVLARWFRTHFKITTVVNGQAVNDNTIDGTATKISDEPNVIDAPRVSYREDLST